MDRGALSLSLDSLGPHRRTPSALHPGAARSGSAGDGLGADRFSPGRAVGPTVSGGTCPSPHSLEFGEGGAQVHIRFGVGWSRLHVGREVY